MIAYGPPTAVAPRLEDEPFALGHALVVDPVRNRIIRGGRAESVEPRVMKLLVYLAQRPGEIVSKSELIERVWRAHVVDEAVHRAISLLRSALTDSRLEPTLIETVPRRGYRLLVEPSLIGADSSRGSVARRWFGTGIAAALAAALLFAAGLQIEQQPELVPAVPAAPVAQQTPLQQERVAPSAKPERAVQVAFAPATTQIEQSPTRIVGIAPEQQAASEAAAPTPPQVQTPQAAVAEDVSPIASGRVRNYSALAPPAPGTRR